MSKYTVDMMHKAGVNDILQKLKVGVESYIRSVARSEEFSMNVLFPQGPYIDFP